MLESPINKTRTEADTYTELMPPAKDHSPNIALKCQHNVTKCGQLCTPQKQSLGILPALSTTAH